MYNKNIPIFHALVFLLLVSANVIYSQMIKTTSFSYNNINGLVNQKIESDNTGTQKIENTTYAFEHDDTFSMFNKNMLSQVYETVVNPWTEAFNKTQTVWSYNQSSAVWQITGTKKFYDYSSAINEAVFTYDIYGNINSSTDADNIIAKYLYGYSHSKLIGIVKNAGNLNIQPLFEDFNDGNISDSDPLNWSSTFGDYSFTENHLKLNSNKEVVIESDIPGNESFNFEVLVKTADGNTGNATLKLSNSGSYYSITIDNNGTVSLKQNGSTLTSAASGTLNKWKRIKLYRNSSGQVSVYVDGAKLIADQNIGSTSESITLSAEGGDILFDNFRVYPANAAMICYTYDPLTFAYNEKIDENFVSTIFTYDALGRLNKISRLDNGDVKTISTFDIQYSSINSSAYNISSPAHITTLGFVSADDQNPFKKIEFFDGLGRKIQEHLKNGTTKIVNSSSTYDNLSRVERTYKPYSLTVYSDNYDSGFENNSTSYYNSGEGNSLYSNVGNFPFSQNVYELDPLNRLSKQSAPGETWKIGSGNEKSFSYSVVNGLYKESITEQQTTDSYKDAFGRTLKSVIDPANLNLITNFEYDNLDRLYRSIDPKGLSTRYFYNNLNQLIKKESPDAGMVQYLYDKKGNLRFIKDANHNGSDPNNLYVGSSSFTGVQTLLSQQFSLYMPALVTINVKLNNNTAANQAIIIKIRSNSATSTAIEVVGANNSIIDVTKKIKLPIGNYQYDIITSGNATSQFTYRIEGWNNLDFIYKKYDAFNRITEEGEYLTNSIDKFNSGNAQDVTFPSTGNYLTAKYVYDENSSEPLAASQKNLKGRLSYSNTYDLDGSAIAFSNFYSYNDMGNVEWVLNKMADGNYSKINYTYNLQGRVTKKYISGGPTPAVSVYKFYEYDQADRLVDVYTSDTDNKGDGKHEAHYTYLADGSVKRLEMGGNVQGVDYSYNPRGWLAQINHQNLDTEGAGFLPDKFGMVIGYNLTEHIATAQTTTPQFSGNISWITYQMANANNNGALVGWTYNYDGANRLTKADYGKYISGAWQTANVYDLDPVAFDAAGNITQLKRYGKDEAGFENMIYNYYGGTNKLNFLNPTSKLVYKDSTQYSAVPTDSTNKPLYIIGQVTLKPGFQTKPGQTVYIGPQISVDYLYDGNGNLTRDLANDIEFVLYNTKNLPVRVCKTDGRIINYTYDANGNRVRNEWDAGDFIYNYYYGADGQTELRMHFADGSPIETIHSVIGNDLIGTYNIVSGVKTHTYFLKDHLGSIKVRVNEQGETSYDDYDPYGYTMDMRSSSTGEERFKFTGKERDVETSYDYFGARYYDARIGRWLQVDPLSDKYPGWSPYNYTLNNPLNIVDPNGDSTFVVRNGNGTYTVTGGRLSGKDNDTGVYTIDKDGKRQFVGNSLTTHSFFDDKNNAIVGATINMNSSEGQKFIVNEIIYDDPSFVYYMFNATGGNFYDLKTRGIENRYEGTSLVQYMYRGSVTDDGTIGSARDFGNVGAGIVAGRSGLSWTLARFGFDALESIQQGRITKEGTPTQKAQRIGFNIGVLLKKSGL